MGRPLHFCAMVAILLHWAAEAPGANCTVTSVHKTPLNDLGPGLYLNLYEGGLYPHGLNLPPVPHETEGVARARGIQPLDINGAPSPGGKIVMLSIGMSNTTQEFCSQGSNEPCDWWTFMGQAATDPRVNHTTLVIVNGARGGQDAATWDSPDDANYDGVRDAKLTTKGLTEKQVQIVWVKEADKGPTTHLPAANANAYGLESRLAAIARAVKVRYPNATLVFYSSRIYAGYATGVSNLNPEPYSYESGFSVKWLIEAQIRQMAGGGLDPIAGNVDYRSVAPFLAWGPYLWADGTTPRSDGLVWLCSDLDTDGTHPSQSGEQKVGTMLLDFMLQSPFTAPWFRAACPAGPDADSDGVADTCDLCPNTISGVPVDTVGCPPAIPGDMNRDGDVDSDDSTAFKTCDTGPNIVVHSADCVRADFDGDGDIDQTDFGLLQRCITGPNTPADPSCAN